ncbi:TonB-dependent receptor [Sphingomonas oligophenolica]
MIRGIGTGHGSAIPSTVATYIDDVPYGSSTATAYGSIGTLDLDPGILERIEVLRGPQGTLYGASSLGGLVKYVTRKPGLTDFTGRVEADGTTVDHGAAGGGVRVMLDGPLVKEKLGVTVSGFYRFDPGFLDDPFRKKSNVNTFEVYGGRIALYWKPVDQLSVELSAVLQNSHSPNTSEVDLTSGLTPIYGKYSQVRWGNENWDFKTRLYSLNANYDLGWGTLTSITSYATRNARWDIDETTKFGAAISGFVGVPNLALFDNVTLDHKKTTQEFRLSSPNGGTLEWLTGVFYTHERSVKPEGFGRPFDATTLQPVPAAYPAGGLFFDTIYDRYTEYAGYADVTLRLGSQFKILGGIRYTHSTEDSDTPSSGALNGGHTDVTGRAVSNTWTYLLTPSFDIDQNNMIYARFATGFRPGGPTNLAASLLAAGAPAAYQPDSLDNYEVGYKAKFPLAHMTVDISAFYLDWKRIQLLTQVGGFNVTGNAGRAHSKGVEFAWTWMPVSGLSLSANGAYTDARMVVDAPLVGAKAGDQLPDTPKFSGNLSADYDFRISDDVGAFIGGNYQYIGSRPIDYVSGAPANYVRPVMPSYDLVNLRAGIKFGGFSIEAYVKNVGNSYGLVRLRSQVKNGISAPFAGAIVQPRTFGISVVDKF